MHDYKVIYVENGLYEEPKEIFVLAKNKADAYDIALLTLEKFENTHPYSAYVDGYRIKKMDSIVKYHKFNNTFFGNAY